MNAVGLIPYDSLILAKCAWCDKLNSSGQFLRCADCRMIKYCSEICQKKHRKQHKLLCDFSSSHWISKKYFNRYEYAEFFHLAKQSLGQTVVNATLYFPRCYICEALDLTVHSREPLITCKKCLTANFCSDCFECNDHPCDLYIFLRRCNSIKETCFKQTGKCPILSTNIMMNESVQFPHDWNSFLSLRKPINSIDGKPLEKFGSSPQLKVLSSSMTDVCTIIWALGELSLEPVGIFCIHIIGASERETSFIESFEEILGFYPGIKHLKLVFIGPNVPSYFSENNEKFKQLQCPEYTKQGRTMEATCISIYYQNFDFPHHLLPDLCVAYNSGLSHNKVNQHWEPGIIRILQEEVPCILTSHSALESNTNLEILMKWEALPLIPPTHNPFRSTEPRVSPLTGLKQVYFHNNFLLVMRGDSERQYRISVRYRLEHGQFGVIPKKIIKKS